MKLRSIISSCLAISLVLTSFAGCGSNNSTSSSQGAGDNSTVAPTPSGKVRILTSPTGGRDDEEMALFAKTLSEKTGLEIEMEKPASDYDNVFMQKIQGGEKYDLIYMNADKYMNLIQQGALMDITDMVKNSEILSNNIDPQEWADITVDGKVYAGFNKKEVFRVVNLNNAHLKAAGIDYKSIEPTLDGYYDVFKKLKESNKDKKDYYPLNIVLSETWDIQPWMAAAGLKNGVVLDADGKKMAPYASEAAAPVWEWFKKLYDEKLLDPSSFVDKTKDLRAKQGAASQNSSVVVDWLIWAGLHNANALNEGITSEQYEVVTLPGLKNPAGEYMLAKGGASLFVVPVNAPNPAGAIKVLEFFATQEGGELLSIGIEGNDYTVENGKYTLTETGSKHGDHGAPMPIFKDFVAPVPYNPSVEESMTYSKYATVDMIIPNEKDYKEIVGKWGIQIIKGEVSTSDGLSKMNQELISRGVTEK